MMNELAIDQTETTESRILENMDFDRMFEYDSNSEEIHPAINSHTVKQDMKYSRLVGNLTFERKNIILSCLMGLSAKQENQIQHIR